MRQINTKVIEKIKRPISALSECFVFSYFGFVSTNLFLSSFLMLAQLHQFINDFFSVQTMSQIGAGSVGTSQTRLGCFVTIPLIEQNIIYLYQKKAQNKTFMRTVVKKNCSMFKLHKNDDFIHFLCALFLICVGCYSALH